MNDTVVPRKAFVPEPHKMQAAFALAAFATVKAKNIAYVSVPITSGTRLYDYMNTKGYKTIGEAKADHDSFFENVVKPNFDDAIKLSNEWRDKLDGAVVAPAEFEKKLRLESAIDWRQDAYMNMWIPLISNKITHMVMADGWEYSNGAGEEYLQAALMKMGRGKRSNIKILDSDGNPLCLDKGITLLADAFERLNDMGLRPRNMAETLALLLVAEQRFDLEKSFNISADPDGKTSQYNSVEPYNRDDVVLARARVKAIYDEHYPDIMPTLEKTSSFDYSPANVLFRSPKKLSANTLG